MIQAKGKTFFQYFFGILLDIAAVSFIVFQVASEIHFENSSKQTTTTQELQLKEDKNPNLQLILNIFDNIEKGKITEALGQCYQLAKQQELPPKIIEYFADFFEFYGVTQNPQAKVDCEISTETFIKNAHYLQDFFKGTKYQDSWVGFAEIIPYYFIKNYDSKLSVKEKKSYDLYKLYVETICEQHQFVSSKGADIICLYMNARYYTINTKFNYELKSLVAEIEHFQEIYPNHLGDNGSLRQQRDYLKVLKDYFNAQINAPFRIKPKWNRDFPDYAF